MPPPARAAPRAIPLAAALLLLRGAGGAGGGVAGTEAGSCADDDGGGAAEEAPPAAPLLASVRRGAVDEAQLQQLELLAAAALANGTERLVRTYRNFGHESKYAGGQLVTYLHHNASAAVLSLLRALASAADGNMPQWGLASRLAGRGEPVLRCLELLEYSPGKGNASTDGNRAPVAFREADPSLGWHDDGATLYTTAVALSSAEADFRGGELQVRDSKQRIHTVADLQRGDAVTWRGWDEHRVLPVTGGRRNVVVAEWWLGPPCSEHENRPDDTLANLQQALELDNASIVLHTILAARYGKKGDAKSAERHLKAALRIDPQQAGLHNHLGEFVAKRGRVGASEKRFRRAIEIDPSHAMAHSNLGAAQLHRKQAELAEASWRESLRLNPRLREPRKNLGESLVRRMDFAAAEDLWQELLRLEPRNVEAHCELGRLRQAQGDLAGAEEGYREALRIDPKSAEARALLKRMGSTWP